MKWNVMIKAFKFLPFLKIFINCAWPGTNTISTSEMKLGTEIEDLTVVTQLVNGRSVS